MSWLGRFWRFDWTRSRGLLFGWWGLCALTLLAFFGEMWEQGSDAAERLRSLSAVIYLYLAVLVGVVIRTAQPGRANSFFQVKPVGSGELLLGRVAFLWALVLFPLYLTQVGPLLWVEPAVGPVTAFSFYFWTLHGGAVAFLMAIAAVSEKLTSYLLRTLLGCAVLMGVSMLCSQFAYRESNWWLVASPEAAELLWRGGLAGLGTMVFLGVCFHRYRGGRSWKVGAGAIGSSLVLAAAWQAIEFRVDIQKAGHPVGTALDLSEAVYRAGISDSMSGFKTQRNDGPGSYGTSMQTDPPYWGGAEERFWFVQGEFEVTGIDPEVAYSARLLDARWVAPDGTVLPYTPPPGTFSVRLSTSTLPPPQPTAERMKALFGPDPDRSRSANERRGTSLLLFGAWTSTYEQWGAGVAGRSCYLRLAGGAGEPSFDRASSGMKCPI